MKSRTLTPEEQSILDSWEALLPPVICRRAVRYFLGGSVSKNVLANSDSRGTGPRGAYRMGRDIMYPTRQLLQWLAETRGMATIVSLRSLDGDLVMTDGKAVPLPPYRRQSRPTAARASDGMRCE